MWCRAVECGITTEVLTSASFEESENREQEVTVESHPSENEECGPRFTVRLVGFGGRRRRWWLDQSLYILHYPVHGFVKL